MANVQVLYLLEREFSPEIMSLARANQRRPKNSGHGNGVDVTVDVDLESQKSAEEETKVNVVQDTASSSGPVRVLKTGTLYKKGGVTGSMYNPRLFELLSDGQLVYYITDITGKRVKKGSIMLTATTKIEKRSGGKKREAKFIIHHPLKDKEWYLWCHKPKVPKPIFEVKPGSEKNNPFINFANSMKNDKAKERALRKKREENGMGGGSKLKSTNSKLNAMNMPKPEKMTNMNEIKKNAAKGNVAKHGGKGGNGNNPMWPFQYLSNLNQLSPQLSKGHSPPPSTDAWNPKPSLGRKLEPKGKVTVLKDDSDDSDDDDDDDEKVEEDKSGRQEAEEWCNLLNEMILKCKKRHVNSTKGYN